MIIIIDSHHHTPRTDLIDLLDAQCVRPAKVYRGVTKVKLWQNADYRMCLQIWA